uniref:NADH dehydrogenase subunit 2 n=1 Tax=Caliscelis shandongensis TaxID=2886254 RepID=UPI001E746E42|nr:NADH dehydrogenase subunit 2 [Caliscelis shandongensis]YP_011014875.1 NADH dehydrogenase subunit 2 [Caliscelis rhabdocladis]UDL72110.1 NADH dehydrogenase subunit 2 [Caliscelis shandongensis]WQB38569.1 NADH dehydrogenase subunit 2 [Caliscelis rhabdocladis]
MLMNSSKMLFMFMMMISTTMMISSSNFLFSWISMEINLISFLPLITKSKKTKDQPMKYFIIQSMSSSTMLMSVLINSKIESPINLSIMLMMSMLMKMGMVPFHLWVPSMLYTMSWENCMMFLTWQKITPMIMVSQMISMKEMILPMTFSLIIGPMSMMKTLSTKKILAFSSISNSPWMIASMMMSKMMFMMNFLIYSTMNIIMIMNFKNTNINFINQMNNKNKINKMSIIMNILSMMGFPPTMGFFMKWMILQKMMEFSKMMSMFMMFSSIISSFIYMNMIIPSLTISNQKKKNYKSKNKLSNDLMINMVSISVLMMLKPN